MRRSMFKSKIHRATVTDANLDYEGSITIDERLMELADILPYERVHVWNVTNGSRFETYAIPGKEWEVCVNGAAAHLAKKGDVVIIATFADMEQEEISDRYHPYQPEVVIVDEHNIPRS